MTAKTLNTVWIEHIYDLLSHGTDISPRGQHTKEILNKSLTIDMNYPVLGYENRHLSYRYCAAEAYWILTGDNTVANLVPWNKNMINYSDDGVVYFGAYGPKIVSQLDYVINKLVEDQSTRQAGLTIWRENPPKTKDVPCTVAIFFSIRDNKLHLTAFMRSSDAWLGIPYDMFTFSMLGCYVLGKLWNKGVKLSLGELTITAVSTHIYEQHFEAARSCLATLPKWAPQAVPEYLQRSPEGLLEYLKKLRDTKPGDPLRWWEVH